MFYILFVVCWCLCHVSGSVEEGGVERESVMHIPEGNLTLTSLSTASSNGVNPLNPPSMERLLRCVCSDCPSNECTTDGYCYTIFTLEKSGVTAPYKKQACLDKKKQFPPEKAHKCRHGHSHTEYPNLIEDVLCCQDADFCNDKWPTPPPRKPPSQSVMRPDSTPSSWGELNRRGEEGKASTLAWRCPLSSVPQRFFLIWGGRGKRGPEGVILRCRYRQIDSPRPPLPSPILYANASYGSTKCDVLFNRGGSRGRVGLVRISKEEGRRGRPVASLMLCEPLSFPLSHPPVDTPLTATPLLAIRQ